MACTQPRKCWDVRLRLWPRGAQRGSKRAARSHTRGAQQGGAAAYLDRRRRKRSSSTRTRHARGGRRHARGGRAASSSARRRRPCRLAAPKQVLFSGVYCLGWLFSVKGRRARQRACTADAQRMAALARRRQPVCTRVAILGGQRSQPPASARQGRLVRATACICDMLGRLRRRCR